jgi:polar amino acid transport system substrate-binding protein
MLNLLALRPSFAFRVGLRNANIGGAVMRSSIFSFVVWPVLTLLVQGAALAQQLTLTVGWEDNPPIQMRTDGDRQGIDMDIVRAMTEHAGYQIRFVKLPWARQLIMLESGELDIAQSASVTEERRRYAVWTEPYRIEKVTLFALDKGPTSIKSLRDLLGKSVQIGYMRGSEFGGDFQALKDHPQLKTSLKALTSNQSALEMLRAGRLDYVIEEQLTFAYMAANQPGPTLAKLSNIDTGKISFMLSKKALERDPKLLDKLNSALQTLKKKRMVDAAFAKYGLKP